MFTLTAEKAVERLKRIIYTFISFFFLLTPDVVSKQKRKVFINLYKQTLC